MDHIEILKHIRLRPGMYIGDTTFKHFFESTFTEVIEKFELYPFTEICLDFNGNEIIYSFHSKQEFLPLIEIQKLITGLEKENNMMWGILRALSNNLSLSFQTKPKQTESLEFDGTKWTTRIVSDTSHFLRISFRLLPEFFSTFQVDDFYLVSSIFKEFALLQAGKKVRIRNKKRNIENCFCYAEGAKSFLLELDNSRFSIGENNAILTIQHSTEFCSYRLDLRFLHSGIPIIQSFVNGRKTQGGSHLEGVAMALDEVFSNKTQGCQTHEFIYCPDNYLKVKIPKTFIGVLSVNCVQPIFRSPTKDNLISEDVKKFIHQTSKDELAEFADIHKLRFKEHW